MLSWSELWSRSDGAILVNRRDTCGSKLVISPSLRVPLRIGITAFSPCMSVLIVLKVVSVSFADCAMTRSWASSNHSTVMPIWPNRFRTALQISQALALDETPDIPVASRIARPTLLCVAGLGVWISRYRGRPVSGFFCSALVDCRTVRIAMVLPPPAASMTAMPRVSLSAVNRHDSAVTGLRRQYATLRINRHFDFLSHRTTTRRASARRCPKAAIVFSGFGCSDRSDLRWRSFQLLGSKDPSGRIERLASGVHLVLHSLSIAFPEPLTRALGLGSQDVGRLHFRRNDLVEPTFENRRPRPRFDAQSTQQATSDNCSFCPKFFSENHFRAGSIDPSEILSSAYLAVLFKFHVFSRGS